MRHHTGTGENLQSGSGGRSRGEARGQARVVVGVPLGNSRQGRENCLGLASLNSSTRLWAIGVASSCLIPGPG